MLTEELRSTLRDESLDFLRVLRALDRLRDRTPGIAEQLRVLDPHGRRSEQAARLGVLPCAGALDSLTPDGKLLCDGVKQYCNWLERPAELPRGVVPAMLLGAAILDIGCGVGCSLLTFSRYGAARVAGVDIIEPFLAMGYVFAEREHISAPQLVLANAARLPFPDCSFDFVFSRLALNYMRTDLALAEASRVARDGAHLVVCVNTLRWNLCKLAAHVRRLQLRSMGYDLLWLLNGVVFHATRQQITWRHRGTMHAAHSPVFHTVGTMCRELKRCGFEDVVHDGDRHPLNPTFVGRRRLRNAATAEADVLRWRSVGVP